MCPSRRLRHEYCDASSSIECLTQARCAGNRCWNFLEVYFSRVMTYSIEANQLSKYFGKQLAVCQLSFQVARCQILGFLGPNGAGKSTTLKMLTGYLQPSSGTVHICGHDIHQQAAKAQQHIGYLPEHNPLYLDMYVREFLQLMGSIRGMRRQQRLASIEEIIVKCGIVPVQNRKIGTLSKGFRQRIGLAQALLHEPAVLILDEPTTGLDPNQLREVRALIKAVSQDKAVILSTHIMQEVEALCDQVLIIHHGKKVAHAPLTQLVAPNCDTLHVTFQEPTSLAALKQLNGLQTVKAISACQYIVHTPDVEAAQAVLYRFAQENNLTLRDLEQPKSALEAVFRALTVDG